MRLCDVFWIYEEGYWPVFKVKGAASRYTVWQENDLFAVSSNGLFEGYIRSELELACFLADKEPI